MSPAPLSTAPVPATDINLAALAELAGIKSQLGMVLQLMQQNHSATQQRIDDLRASLDQRIADMGASMDSRFDNLDERVARLEANERATAIKTAASAAVSGLLGAAGIKFFG